MIPNFLNFLPEWIDAIAKRMQWKYPRHICTPDQLIAIHDAFTWAKTHAADAIEAIGGRCSGLAACLRAADDTTMNIQCGEDCKDGASGESDRTETRLRVCGS